MLGAEVLTRQQPGDDPDLHNARAIQHVTRVEVQILETWATTATAATASFCGTTCFPVREREKPTTSVVELLSSGLTMTANGTVETSEKATV